jgi:predicted ATPase/class 3 adenylate cyclase
VTRNELPTGTVTFLFTDIEGSTRLLQELGERWRGVLEEHNHLLRKAIRGAGGVDLRTEGDAVFAVFRSAPSAVSAAAAAQRAVADRAWPEPVRVRMGLHTGEGVAGGDEYVGIDVHRAARIASAAHGGQVLLSVATRSLVDEALPAGVSLRSLGRHRLKDLPHPVELHELVIEGLPSEFPPPRTLEVPTNLPAPLTSFVGRQKELARVKDLLLQTRLLTLTGPGGCGKTRVAIEAATGLLPSFSDGAFFVDLAPVSDPDLVPSSIASAVDVREEPTRPILETLREALRDREMLLVLDNFEQILRGAPIITELLAGAPRLRALVTSRAALHVSGEQELEVPPMALPDGQDLSPDRLTEYESVALFEQRARGVDPDFAVTEGNAATVAEICRRLEGLPLAIELAASRIKFLSPSAMLDRLQQRLAFLAGGAKDQPARQRALRETIRWSFDLLDHDEQVVFSRLAAFPGGWTIEAGEAVANPDRELDTDTLDALGSLVDKSLVRKQHDPTAARFRMFETIREFGLRQLEEAGESEAIHRRHAEHFMRLAEGAEPDLTTRDPGRLNRLETEHDNIRAALRWSIHTGEADLGLRMVGAMWRFWQMRDHLAEGRRWTEVVLRLPTAAARTAARAKALLAAGSLAYYLRDTDAVRGFYEESLAISRELGDRQGEAEGMYNLGFACMLSGDLRAAKDFELRAEEIYRELGDRVRLANVYMAHAMVAYLEGDLETEGPLLDKARATYRAVGDLWGIGVTSGQLAGHALRVGDYDRARTATLEALEVAVTLGNSYGIAVSLEGTAVRAIRMGRAEVGIRLAGAADRLKEEAGGEPPPALVGVEDPRDVARESLTEDRIAALWEEGRAMSVEEALAVVGQVP